MTSPQLTADDELREILKTLSDEADAAGVEVFEGEGTGTWVQAFVKAEAAIISWADKRQLDPFDYVEPCEPDCSEVRHARHAGQWEMATRMEAAIKSRIEKERG